MNIFAPLVWVAFILLGIIGFIASVPPFLHFIGSGGGYFDDQKCYHIKNRDKWLRQHFGEEGRRRWLLNEYWSKRENQFLSSLPNTYNADDQKVIKLCAKFEQEKQKAREAGFDFGKPRRASDGGCIGWVQMGYALSRVGSDRVANPPWSLDFEEYIEEHARSTEYFTKESCPHCKHHGEPRGMDWLAAGFWDPVRRTDGVLVDPIALLKLDLIDSVWGHGILTDPVVDDPDFKMKDEIHAHVRKRERELGRRSPLPRERDMGAYLKGREERKQMGIG